MGVDGQNHDEKSRISLFHKLKLDIRSNMFRISVWIKHIVLKHISLTLISTVVL